MQNSECLQVAGAGIPPGVVTGSKAFGKHSQRPLISL